MLFWVKLNSLTNFALSYLKGCRILNYNNIDTVVNNRRDIDTINRLVSCGKILTSQIWGWAERDKNIHILRCILSTERLI